MAQDGAQHVVAPRDIQSRTEKQSEQYAPYGMLYILFVTWMARKWTYVGNDMVVAEADILAGSTQAGKAAWLKVSKQFDSLFDPSNKMSVLTAFDVNQWKDATLQERGGPVGCM